MRRSLFLLLILAVTGLCLAQINAAEDVHQHNKTKANATLTKVLNKKVCMINNMLFPNDQIPVQVEGKTYFGCCEMCKKTLVSDKTSRFAIDPITKKPVDKALAVIGALADGKVLYFANQDNFLAFKKVNSLQ